MLAQRLEEVGALAGEGGGRVRWWVVVVVVMTSTLGTVRSDPVLNPANSGRHGEHELCGCCDSCPCCRRTGTGPAPSWPTGSRCRCARCGATSTGCASSGTRCRRSAASTADTSSAAGAAMPPLVLDDDEAVAIALGLQAAAHGAVAGIAEASVSALTKIVQVMPPRLRRRVDALRAATTSTPWRPGDVERGRPGRPHDGRAGMPRHRPAAVRLHGRERRAHGARGRAAAARRAGPPLVPGRLRPGPARLAELPPRPARAARRGRRPVPAPGAARRRPGGVRAGAGDRPARGVRGGREGAGARGRRPAGASAPGRRCEPDVDDPGGACVVQHGRDQLQWPVLGLVDARRRVRRARAAQSCAAHLAELGCRSSRAGRPRYQINRHDLAAVRADQRAEVDRPGRRPRGSAPPRPAFCCADRLKGSRGTIFADVTGVHVGRVRRRRPRPHEERQRERSGVGRAPRRPQGVPARRTVPSGCRTRRQRPLGHRGADPAEAVHPRPRRRHPGRGLPEVVVRARRSYRHGSRRQPSRRRPPRCPSWRRARAASRCAAVPGRRQRDLVDGAAGEAASCHPTYGVPFGATAMSGMMSPLRIGLPPAPARRRRPSRAGSPSPAAVQSRPLWYRAGHEWDQKSSGRRSVGSR